MRKPKKSNCLKDLDEPTEHCSNCDVPGCVYHSGFDKWLIARKNQGPIIPSVEELQDAAAVIYSVEFSEPIDIRQRIDIGKLIAVLKNRIMKKSKGVPNLEKPDDYDKYFVKVGGERLDEYSLPPSISLLYFISSEFEYIVEEVEDMLGNGELTLCAFLAHRYSSYVDFVIDCARGWQAAGIIEEVFDKIENENGEESETDDAK